MEYIMDGYGWIWMDMDGYGWIWKLEKGEKERNNS